jgi:hypothetical protein
MLQLTELGARTYAYARRFLTQSRVGGDFGIRESKLRGGSRSCLWTAKQLYSPKPLPKAAATSNGQRPLARAVVRIGERQ